jgi:thioesterase domain-containing protein
LVQIWEELLGVKPVGVADDFFELGGHSIIATRLFARINSVWRRNLPLSTLLEAPTIEQLARLLRDDSWNPASITVVPVRATGSRPPLFIISGIGGNVVRFRRLANYLDQEQPVFALQPPGLARRGPRYTRIEDMAAHYIDEMKRLGLRGPYHLAGYSFGGLVTFEMAQQLAAAGDRVGLLAMLEAPEWGYLCRRAKLVNSQARLERYRGVIANILFTRGRFEYLWERLRRRGSNLVFSICAKFGWRLPQRLGAIQDINSFAAGLYMPRPYRGRVSVFRTQQAGLTPIDDDTLGWGPLVLGGVEVFEVPGDHNDITSEPNVRILSQKLGSALRKAQAGAAQSDSAFGRNQLAALERAGHSTTEPILLVRQMAAKG